MAGIPVGGCIDRRTGKVTLIRQEVPQEEIDRIVKALMSAAKLGETKRSEGA